MQRLFFILLFFSIISIQPVFSYDNFDVRSAIKNKKVTSNVYSNKYIVELPERYKYDKSDAKLYLKSVAVDFPLTHVKDLQSRVFQGFHVIETNPKQIAELLKNGIIKSATQDVLFELQDVVATYPIKPGYYSPVRTNDSFVSQQWGLHQARFPGAWNRVTQPQSLIFIGDTWVDKNHPDLNSEQIENVVSFLHPTMQESFKHYHGTHVAGIISARTNNSYGISGSTWNARIVPIEVCASVGCPLSSIAEAIVYAADSYPEFTGPRVLNLSLGAPAHAEMLKRAVEYAISKNVSIIAAAGNSTYDSINFYPAAYPGVISVGALAKARFIPKIGYPSFMTPTELAWFSNYGPKSLSILAPGDNILSTIPTNYTSLTPEQLEQMYLELYGEDAFSFLSGTSMASPFVAGAVSLLRSEFPNLNNHEIKRILETRQPKLNVSGRGTYVDGQYSFLDMNRLIQEANYIQLPIINRQNSQVESVQFDLAASYTSRYNGYTHVEGIISNCDSLDRKIRIRWFTFSLMSTSSPSALGYSIRNCGERFSVELPISLPEEIGYLTMTPFIMAFVDEVDNEGEVQKLNPILFPDGNEYLDLRNMNFSY